MNKYKAKILLRDGTILTMAEETLKVISKFLDEVREEYGVRILTVTYTRVNKSPCNLPGPHTMNRT